MKKNNRSIPDIKTGIYLVALFVFAAVSFFIGFFGLRDTTAGRLLMMISALEALIWVGLLIYSYVSARNKRKELEAYVESIVYDSENAKNNTLMNFPLPIAVFRLTDSAIVWANSAFFDACGGEGKRMDARISDLVPEFSGKWLTEGQQQYPSLVTLQGKKYRVHGNVIRPDSNGDENVSYLGITYWVDITEYDDIRIEYEQSRPVAAIMVVDNFEELLKNQPDREKNRIRDNYEELFQRWADQFHTLFRRYERDRYLAVFEKRDLTAMKEDKFSILEKIHKVESPTGITASVSMGVSEDAVSFPEALQFADMAVELALTRGGDQAVVKNRLSYEFFGGRGGEIEKRTKVKSRVMANTLRELIKDSSRVFVMGHRYGDLDSVGAAVGICCLSRYLDVRCNIVVDENTNAAEPLIEKLKAIPEYHNAFMTTQDAMLHADGRTLLVIVDTNRPEQVEDADLLDACNRVAVIDHHRVAATYIHNAVLGFIEPYASSACELLTEILQEVLDIGSIQQCEAEALMAGIVLDTKNFTLRTGERTFDAAAYLRRAGADPIAVKKLLQSDMEATRAKYRILQDVNLYKNVAVAVCNQPTDRIVAAKAADELLNISGVDASIVLAPSAAGGSFASARSIGDMNMQILMEKLGGGGNRSAAAVQLRDTDVAQAKDTLYKAIDEYFA